MENFLFNLESRIINGSRYYRLSFWNSQGTEKRDFIASTLEAVRRAAKKAGFCLSSSKATQTKLKI